MSKIYLPSQYLNSNYTYKINSNNTISVITNNNCFNQYNTTYCDCYDIYPHFDYTKANNYSCSIGNNGSNYIAYSNFSSDIWYRNDITYILIIFLILFIFIIKYPLRIFMRLFGRWLKL